jgi:peptidoglycan/xylan/chitin deacetylase (PgdA/CDA1 family)
MHPAWFLAALVALPALVLAAWLFLRARVALPVLMYHDVDPARRDRLTVSTAQLERQLAWLAAEGYRAITLRELLEAAENGRAPPGRPVLLTFDDAYVSTLTHALPILQRFGMTAAVFVPTAYVGGRNEWDGGSQPLMDVDQLRQLAPAFELALHSHRHPNYRHLAADAIRTDVADNLAAMRATGLPFLPAFAFPYGGRPKDRKTKEAMREAMRQAGIRLAFRIGGRLNRFPLRDRYEVQRIDVNGADTMRSFAWKVRLAKIP